jgi:hypothetical protein
MLQQLHLQNRRKNHQSKVQLEWATYHFYHNYITDGSTTKRMGQSSIVYRNDNEHLRSGRLNINQLSPSFVKIEQKSQSGAKTRIQYPTLLS